MSCDFGLVGFLGQGEELNFYMNDKKDSCLVTDRTIDK